MGKIMLLMGALALGTACGGGSDDEAGEGGDSGSSTSGGTESGGESGEGSGSGSETGSGGDSFPCEQACDCAAGEVCIETTQGCGVPDCTPTCSRRCASAPPGCGTGITCDCITTELCPSYGECSVVDDMVSCEIPGA